MLAGLGVVLGLVAAYPTIEGMIYRMIRPSLDIAMFTRDEGGHARLFVDEPYPCPIDDAAVERRQVAVPLNLALRNRDRKPLEVVRLEMTYDATRYVIQGGGEQRLGTDPGVLVYEHEIASLDRSDLFTMLPTVDTVYVPFMPQFVPTIALDKDGVPVFVVAMLSLLAGEAALEHRLIVHITVHCRERPPVEYAMSLQISGYPQLWTPSDSSEVVLEQSAESDCTLFMSMSGGAQQVLDTWMATLSLGERAITYTKARRPDGGTYQVVQVDGTVRRVMCDVDSDGRVEYELWDSSGDGAPDKKARFDPPYKTVSWPQEAVMTEPFETLPGVGART